jgi:ubiquinone/menaquinone biosynthesis C-methylase UbiE
VIDRKSFQVQADDYGLPKYFDLQAKIGHTKHLGGEAVTQKLAELCQLDKNKFVCNVGSGSGISAAYLVEHYDCQVVGVDILPGMVVSARKWAQENRISDSMEFQLGDAQNLPFDDDLFDAVICESVNVFIPDKEKGMREYVRVVRPGGSIALSEAIWNKKPPEGVKEIIIEATGQPFQSSEVWENLLEGAGLVDIHAETYGMDMRGEARNQFGLLNWRAYMRIMWKAILSLLTDRETRSLIKYVSSNPSKYFEYMGYGIYHGRLPE